MADPATGPAAGRTCAIDRPGTDGTVVSRAVVGHNGDSVRSRAGGLPTPSTLRPMRYRQTLILLPCHSMEDFPVHHTGEEADGVIAGYTALWHPSLVATTEALPQWHRADDPPEDVADQLLVVPGLSAGELPTGFSRRCREAGGGARPPRK